MLRFDSVFLTAVAKAAASAAVITAIVITTASTVAYIFNLDFKSTVFTAGIVVSLAWNIFNTVETKKIEDKTRQRDITFREFDNIVASPLRDMLRQLMNSGDRLADLFDLTDHQDKIEHAERMNKNISRQFYSLQNECMRIDRLENENFGFQWSDLAFDAEVEILSGFEESTNAENKEAFVEGVGNVQFGLDALNISIQREIYERIHKIG